MKNKIIKEAAKKLLELTTSEIDSYKRLRSDKSKRKMIQAIAQQRTQERQNPNSARSRDERHMKQVRGRAFQRYADRTDYRFGGTTAHTSSKISMVKNNNKEKGVEPYTLRQYADMYPKKKPEQKPTISSTSNKPKVSVNFSPMKYNSEPTPEKRVPDVFNPNTNLGKLKVARDEKFKKARQIIARKRGKQLNKLGGSGEWSTRKGGISLGGITGDNRDRTVNWVSKKSAGTPQWKRKTQASPKPAPKPRKKKTGGITASSVFSVLHSFAKAGERKRR
jgi:hypothetical protein